MRDYIEESGLQRAVLVFSSYRKKKEKGDGALSVTGKAASVLQGTAAGDEVDMSKAGFAEGILTVQYNPKSLNFGASAASTGNGDMENSPKSGSIHMSVELVFVQNYIGDTSVMEQMGQMFLIMLTDQGKHLEFYWADMHIQGILTSFQGSYDMFDAAGIPVSGKMTLGIAVLDGTNYTKD